MAHYRAASEARNAQAMFNLAWMHQYGIGMVLTLLNLMYSTNYTQLNVLN